MTTFAPRSLENSGSKPEIRVVENKAATEAIQDLSNFRGTVAAIAQKQFTDEAVKQLLAHNPLSEHKASESKAELNAAANSANSDKTYSTNKVQNDVTQLYQACAQMSPDVAAQTPANRVEQSKKDTEKDAPTNKSAGPDKEAGKEQVTETSDGAKVTTAGGRVSKIEYPNHSSREFKYDNSGQLSEVISTGAKGEYAHWKKENGTWTDYDKEGKQKLDEEGKPITDTAERTVKPDGSYLVQDKETGEKYLYSTNGSAVYKDKDDRVTQVNHPDGTSEVYGYDEKGRVATVDKYDSQGKYTDGLKRDGDSDRFFHVDENDKVIQENGKDKVAEGVITVDGDGNARTEDKEKNTAVTVAPDGTTVTEYLPTHSSKVEFPDHSSIIKDGQGNIMQTKSADGTTRDFGYDQSGQLEDVLEPDGSQWLKTKDGWKHYTKGQVDGEAKAITVGENGTVEITKTDGSKVEEKPDDKTPASVQSGAEKGTDHIEQWGNRAFQVKPDGHAEYQVKGGNGDCLWRIARDVLMHKHSADQGYRPTNKEILEEVHKLANYPENKISNPDRIYPGQVIKIPPDDAKPSPTTVEKQGSSNNKGETPDQDKAGNKKPDGKGENPDENKSQTQGEKSDEKGKPKVTKDENENTTVSYPDGSYVVEDKNHHVAKVHYPNNYERSFQYNDRQELVGIQDSLGNQWKRDSAGHWSIYDAKSGTKVKDYVGDVSVNQQGNIIFKDKDKIVVIEHGGKVVQSANASKPSEDDDSEDQTTSDNFRIRESHLA